MNSRPMQPDSCCLHPSNCKWHHQAVLPRPVPYPNGMWHMEHCTTSSHGPAASSQRTRRRGRQTCTQAPATGAVTPQQPNGQTLRLEDDPGLSWQPVSRSSPRHCLVHDYHNQLVPYHEAWQWQKDRVALMTSSPQVETNLPVASAHSNGRGYSTSSNASGNGTGNGGSNGNKSSGGRSTSDNARDSVIILQHPPVYTLGAGSTETNLLFDPMASPQQIPVVRTERGGEVTYHGPGQLVLYPMLDLTHHRQDLHWYMRALEEVVIQALWEVSGIRGERMPGLTGVWVGGAKVAAIGVRAKRWVTYHGLALNVCPDLTPFSHIIPCGIQGKGVTSVEALLQGESSTALDMSGRPLDEEGRKQLLDEYGYGLLDAFAQVFNVELERCEPNGRVR